MHNALEMREEAGNTSYIHIALVERKIWSILLAQKLMIKEVIEDVRLVLNPAREGLFQGNDRFRFKFHKDYEDKQYRKRIEGLGEERKEKKLTENKT